jgi:hypothetical protein
MNLTEMTKPRKYQTRYSRLGRALYAAKHPPSLGYGAAGEWQMSKQIRMLK